MADFCFDFTQKQLKLKPFTGVFCCAWSRLEKKSKSQLGQFFYLDAMLGLILIDRVEGQS